MQVFLTSHCCEQPSRVTRELGPQDIPETPSPWCCRFGAGAEGQGSWQPHRTAGWGLVVAVGASWALSE